MENKKVKVLLWDADYIAYKHSPDSTIKDAIDNVELHIANVLKFSKCDYFAMFLSKGPYFRHGVSENSNGESSYKANRGQANLPWVNTIKAYLKVKYKAKYGKGWEADDDVVYWNNKKLYHGTYAYQEHPTSNGLNQSIATGPKCFVEDIKEPNAETILCSCDKDVLNNYEGKHLNPSKKTSSKIWEPVWIIKSMADAEMGIWKQMVIGDSSDGIKGLSGKGVSWCEKNFTGKSTETIRSLVFDEYIKSYGESNGIYEFQKSYRQLYLLKNDEDFNREIGILPFLPEFIKNETIIDDIIEEQIDF